MPGYKTWLVLLGLATLVWIGFFVPVLLVPCSRPHDGLAGRGYIEHRAGWEADQRVIRGRETLFLSVTGVYVPLAVLLILGAVSAWAQCRSAAQRLTSGWWIHDADVAYTGCQYTLAFLLSLPLIVALCFAARWWLAYLLHWQD